MSTALTDLALLAYLASQLLKLSNRVAKNVRQAKELHEHCTGEVQEGEDCDAECAGQGSDSDAGGEGSEKE